jgi:hypothetical protein
VAGAQSVMRENINRLHERGEKLGLLQEKAERLQNKAKDFHDMIRQHNMKEAAKKWWQI